MAWCHFLSGLMSYSGGSASRGGGWHPPRRTLPQAVRILLECILIVFMITYSPRFRETLITLLPIWTSSQILDEIQTKKAYCIHQHSFTLNVHLTSNVYRGSWKRIKLIVSLTVQNAMFPFRQSFCKNQQQLSSVMSVSFSQDMAKCL